jgi:sulfide:quinone oxidoreductase
VSPSPGSAHPRPRVLVAGGGIAALEALLALREHGGRMLELALLAPGTHFLNRPGAVAEPFGLGAARPVAFADVADRSGATIHAGTLEAVRPGRRVALTGAGDELAYDALLIAVGARAGEPLPGSVPFGGPEDVPGLAAVLGRAERGELGSIVFTADPRERWLLPLYELAIMAAIDLRDRGAGTTEITVVAPEERPLWVFGEPAAAQLERLLAERGIRLIQGRARGFSRGRLELADGPPVAADAAVALAPRAGPRIDGLAADDDGYLPVDGHGRVAGAAGVYAAGDATAFPVKQGGLACQQADAAAAAIAADLGRGAAAAPFRPVLRGLLLTGGAPLYLRAELDLAGAVKRRSHATPELRGEVSERALWWPPGKVAGRLLAPYLSTARPPVLERAPLADRTRTAAPATAGNGGDGDDAVGLALLMAGQDVAAGDHAQALHALDAAAALAGGVLPADAAALRDECVAALAAR